jgi:hypothetical protein
MNRKAITVLAAASLAAFAACGATPTASTTPPGEWQANAAPADTSTGRVPNLFGSGN